MPLQIIRQDITKMRVDAIVNTTNEEMIGYSGVDYAVHRGAGTELDAECAKIAPLGLGCVKMTKGYNLDAKYIIHTSGPVWHGGLQGESIILRSCYTEALKLAHESGFESIAFPLISAGAYGYPKDQVLKFAIRVITEFLCDHELTVFICILDRNSYEFSRTLYSELNEIINEDRAEMLLEEDIRCSARYEASLTPKRTPRISAALKCSAPFPEEPVSVAGQSLHEYMKKMDKSFAYKLFDYIDEKGMTDVECYKKANVDKKTFSKIKCNPDTYKPSKQTAVAFAIALRLNLDETQDLLASAGLTLSRSFAFDKIIRYFIQKGNYDIFEINEALFEFDQVLLGC